MMMESAGVQNEAMQPLRRLQASARLIDAWRQQVARYGYESIYIAPDTPQHPRAVWQDIWPDLQTDAITRPVRLYSLIAAAHHDDDSQMRLVLAGAAKYYAEQEVVDIAMECWRYQHKKNDETLQIVLNNRMALGKILQQYVGLSIVQLQLAMHLIDQRAQHEPAVFMQKLHEIVADIDGASEKIDQLATLRSATMLPAEVQSYPEVQQLCELERTLSAYRAVYDVFDMAGQGRYMGNIITIWHHDKLYAEGGCHEAVVRPGVANIVELTLRAQPQSRQPLAALVDVALVVVDDAARDEACTLARALRQEGVRVEVDVTARRADQQVRAALKAQVPFIVLVGEANAPAGVYTLQAVGDGVEERMSAERIVARVLDYRQSDGDEAIFTLA